MNPVVLNALAEPNRMHIVELLREKPHAVGEIADILPIGQPQVSKHLKVLADAEIVDVHPFKNQRIYSLSSKRFQEMDHWLEKYRNLWEEQFNQLDILLKNATKNGR
jgi:DNA-binding transcriptional ArsR family regulator